MRFVSLSSVENGSEDKKMEGGNAAAVILLGKGRHGLENLGKTGEEVSGSLAMEVEDLSHFCSLL